MKTTNGYSDDAETEGSDQQLKSDTPDFNSDDFTFSFLPPPIFTTSPPPTFTGSNSLLLFSNPLAIPESISNAKPTQTTKKRPSIHNNGNLDKKEKRERRMQRNRELAAESRQRKLQETENLKSTVATQALQIAQLKQQLQKFIDGEAPSGKKVKLGM